MYNGYAIITGVKTYVSVCLCFNMTIFLWRHKSTRIQDVCAMQTHISYIFICMYTTFPQFCQYCIFVFLVSDVPQKNMVSLNLMIKSV